MNFEEKIFIELYRKNNRQAYTMLCEKYFDRLFLFASNMVFREDVAKDIVQDVFIQMYEKTPEFINIYALQGYLFKCVRSRCYNYLRDLKVKDKHQLLYTQAIVESDNMDVFDDDFFDSLDYDKIMCEIDTIIENLPEKCRDICHMRFIEKRKYVDIAQTLGVSENNVKMQISRGMEKIRLGLKRYNFSAILFIISVLR